MLTDLDKTILETLLNAQGPVAGRDLAQRCGVAINTIRKEIELINREVEPNGLVIRSKTSQGHWVEVTDSKAARRYVGDLRYHLKRSRLAGMTWSAQVYYLARRVLSAGRGVPVETLCRELYCSRSALNRDLRQVREIFADYGLTLVNRRGGYGLTVRGNEWDIRQCLIYQHKVCQIGEGMAGPQEGEFRAQFLTDYGPDHGDAMRETLIGLLREQEDFTLPLAHYPKILHSVSLSQSRSKYRENISFTETQARRARETAEYRFARALHERLAPRTGETAREEDILCTAMLLLSYESQNRRIGELPGWEGYREDLGELKARLGRLCDPAIFDTTFDRDFLCFLYTLENRRVFGVRADPEPIGSIRRSGLRSADFCLEFARFYRERHGVAPDREDTLRAFYHFSRILRREEQPCWYAKNILVISRYGIDCARAMAGAVEQCCGPAAARVTPCEYLEHLEGLGDYDLVVTDSGGARLRLYDLPTVEMDFAPGGSEVPALTEYFRGVERAEELALLGEDSFRREKLGSREEVLERAAALLAGHGFDYGAALVHLRENDSLIDLERGDGLVFLPVLLERPPQEVFFVLLTPTPVEWGGEGVHAFVCYTRSGEPRRGAVLRRVQMALMEQSRETLRAWATGRREPLADLYPRKS